MTSTHFLTATNSHNRTPTHLSLRIQKVITMPTPPGINSPASPAITTPTPPGINSPASPAITRPIPPRINSPGPPAITTPTPPGINITVRIPRRGRGGGRGGGRGRGRGGHHVPTNQQFRGQGSRPRDNRRANVSMRRGRDGRILLRGGRSSQRHLMRTHLRVHS